VHFDGADSTGVASTKDQSGGLYHEHAGRDSVGDLALRLPLRHEHVVVKAEVVTANPGHGVGVKFSELSEPARALMVSELPQLN